jgi:RimJ/RimL family protein N-acetyltransferase
VSDVLIRAPLELLHDWLNERVGLARSEDFRAIGRVVDGELVGVVGFTGYNGASLQMHMAGDTPKWGSRRLLRAVFGYAFNQCGCNMVFGMVPSNNAKALEIDLRLGFTEIANIPGAHPDGSLHVLIMRRDNCRWLR